MSYLLQSCLVLCSKTKLHLSVCITFICKGCQLRNHTCKSASESAKIFTVEMFGVFWVSDQDYMLCTARPYITAFESGTKITKHESAIYESPFWWLKMMAKKIAVLCVVPWLLCSLVWHASRQDWTPINTRLARGLNPKCCNTRF